MAALVPIHPPLFVCQYYVERQYRDFSAVWKFNFTMEAVGIQFVRWNVFSENNNKVVIVMVDFTKWRHGFTFG